MTDFINFQNFRVLFDQNKANFKKEYNIGQITKFYEKYFAQAKGGMQVIEWINKNVPLKEELVNETMYDHLTKDKFCNIELAKMLCQMEFKQESEYYYHKGNVIAKKELKTDRLYKELYSAFTSYELAKILSATPGKFNYDILQENIADFMAEILICRKVLHSI